MSDQSNDGARARQGRIVCAVSGRELPRKYLVNLETVRPSLVERMRQDDPSLPADAYISRDELARYRTLYVTELLKAESGDVSEIERQVAESLATHETLAENVEEDFASDRTLGERLSDVLASFGGSWSFLIVSRSFSRRGWLSILMRPAQPRSTLILTSC